MWSRLPSAFANRAASPTARFAVSDPSVPTTIDRYISPPRPRRQRRQAYALDPPRELSAGGLPVRALLGLLLLAGARGPLRPDRPHGELTRPAADGKLPNQLELVDRPAQAVS